MKSKREFTRREATQLSIGALGTSLTLIACSKRAAPDSTSSGEFFSAEELVRLAEVAEMMIPATDTPGARAANVHGFIDRMMSQWARGAAQGSIRAVLREIDARATAKFGVGFVDLTPRQRFEVLSAMDAEAFHAGGDLDATASVSVRQRHSFRTLKQLVFLGYYQSEIGATQELQYRLAPGPYQACVPLERIGRAWAGEYWSLPAIQEELNAVWGEGL